MVINFNELAFTISYWLSYQNRIGREFMNSESSLKYPIADYLTNLHNSANQIKLEQQHFIFDDRYIDIIVEENKVATHAFELKVAKYETSQKKEKQRILNDLLRLYFMSKFHNTESYFIISGEHQNFMSYFRSISKNHGQYELAPTADKINDPVGFYTKWFQFSANASSKRVISVKDETEADYKILHDTFLSTYKLKDSLSIKSIYLPEYITTECVAITPIFSGAPLSHLVGIWKVS